jgi:hypothetical protein
MPSALAVFRLITSSYLVGAYHSPKLTPNQGILVVVTGNFLHEHHDPAPQGGIINSHERSDQP